MTNFKSVDQVLDFAIDKEIEASDYYIHLADRMEEQWMKDLFTSFSREEQKHEAKLKEVKAGNLLMSAQGKVADLKIADYVVDVEDKPGMDFQDALILAMKREKAAFKLYNDLADSTDDQGLKDTFLALAQEEAKHKLRIEVTYDDQILTEN
jgi:rubrerythrin